MYGLQLASRVAESLGQLVQLINRIGRSAINHTVDMLSQSQKQATDLSCIACINHTFQLSQIVGNCIVGRIIARFQKFTPAIYVANSRSFTVVDIALQNLKRSV